jgi:hypothetical protein
MVREVYREVGVDYPEEVNEDKEECKYCGGDCPNDEEHACDGYLGDIDDLYKVTEERDIDDNEEVCTYCGEPRDDKFSCCDENHWETKKEFDDNMNEAKDTIKYDPKTGKLTGWEHEGDWEKQTKKKDPVGKVHNLSDLARRRTEKMADKEKVEETDYSEYDKPTFLRKKPKELPKKSGWTGYNTDEPAYKRQADYNQEREQMKKLAGLK